MSKYYKEVIINSEADLPKEEGFYWGMGKNNRNTKYKYDDKSTED